MASKEYKYASLANIARDFRPDLERSRAKKPFILLLGPSAIGKTTIIQELNGITGGKFGYVTPYTTRELRAGEQDKIHIGETHFQRMYNNGEFAYVKFLYGHRYGTPKEMIQKQLDWGKIPILDFPLSDIHLLKLDGLNIIPIYIFPENIMGWYKQLKSTGRNTISRLKSGVKELRSFSDHDRHNPKNSEQIEFAVVNKPGEVKTTANEIIDFFLKAIY